LPPSRPEQRSLSQPTLKVKARVTPISESIRRFLVAQKLYVGNLSYNVSSSDLQTLFTPFGNVNSAEVIMDRTTGRSKGFGFVEMEQNEEAAKAIAGLNGQQQDGRALTVNEAKPRESRGPGGHSSSGSYGRSRY
jgi:cold-inducible RNA-binding protein